MFRVPPALGGPEHYQTYIMHLGVMHWQPATCAEVDCQAHANGWVTTVDEGTQLGRQQAHYIRHDRSRSAAEARCEDGLTAFTFTAGQRCFSEHQKPAGRMPRFFVRGGDWRGNPRQIPLREHTRAEFWVEDMQTTLDAIKTVQQRG